MAESTRSTQGLDALSHAVTTHRLRLAADRMARWEHTCSSDSSACGGGDRDQEDDRCGRWSRRRYRWHKNDLRLRAGTVFHAQIELLCCASRGGRVAPALLRVNSICTANVN